MHACSNCGAKMPIVDPGVVQTCAFCGAQAREPVPQARPVAAHYVAPAAGRKTSAGVVAMFLVLGAVVPAIVIAVVVMQRKPTDARPAGTAATPPAKPKLTLANVATSPIQGIQPIDAPGMLGTFEAFDPLANVEWAKSIARAWKADAIMHRIDAARVAKDGLVNVKTTPKAQVTYRFYSPKCVSDFASSTSVVVPTNECGMFVKVMADEEPPSAHVQIVAESPSSAADGDYELKSPVCTLAKAFAALEAAGKLPARPVYDTYLYDVRFKGKVPDPRWSISQITSGVDTIGYVNATTCALK